MAKKKEAATPEQRLQEALVPCTEWPYKLPENWCWTYMKNIAQWGSGGTPSRKIEEYYTGDIPWIKTGELNDDYIFETGEHITQDAVNHSSAKLFPVNTVAIAMYGATIGKVGILGMEAATNQACACAIANPIADFKYLFYYARSQKTAFIDKGKGGAQPNISQEIIKNHPFPLSPLPEQQRIVDRIESLFARLDEAKEKAQAALDSFEPRKAAILHKAFTGELTEKWRKEHGIGMESWKNTTLGNQCSSIFDGDHMPPPKSDTGIPFLVISNVNTGHLSFENTRFVPESYYESLSDTRRPELGDVLYTLVGSYGIPVVVDSEQPFCFQRHMALLKPNDIDSKYLWYLLQTKEMYRKATDIATGTAQLTVPIKGLRNMEFKCAGRTEQLEIVRILDSLLAKEQQAKEAAEAVLDQIDLIKKSILSRAFRGALGTNNPADPSSTELLKQILQKEV